MAEAAEFIKEKFKLTSKHLTKKMHAIVDQYFTYKKEIKKQVDQSEDYERKYKETMLAYTQQAPCFEATFAMSAKSKLRLYDCVVPEVKQLAIRCVRCRKERDFAGIHDPPMTDLEVKHYLGYWQKTATENANKEYIKENRQLKNELEVVDYYTRYMEEGLDSKEIMRRHMILDKKFNRLRELHKQKMEEFTQTVWDLR